MPLTVAVSPVHLPVQTPQSIPDTVTVTWEKPENSEKFDLEYFKIQAVLVSELETGTHYSINGTTTELQYLLTLPLQSSASITITVTAISKCSQQLGHGSRRWMILVPFTRHPYTIQTEESPSAVKIDDHIGINGKNIIRAICYNNNSFILSGFKEKTSSIGKVCHCFEVLCNENQLCVQVS